MRKYRIYEGLWAAFYSPDFYRNVVYGWKGAGLLYLLIVVAVTSLIMSVRFAGEMWEVRAQIPAIAEQFPEISVANGILTTTPEGRHEINDPETGDLLAIIDTSLERPPATSLERQNVPVFITKSQILVTNAEGREQVQSLSQMDGMELTPEELADVGQVLVVIVIIATPFVLTIFLYFWRTIQVFAFALLTWIYAMVMGRKLDYLDRIRLTSAAITPALFFGAFAGPQFPNGDIVWFSLTVLYLAFAVYVAQPPEPPPLPDRSLTPIDDED